MKMDRNINNDGLGKYALANLRKLRENVTPEILNAFETLCKAGIIERGIVGEEDEFFAIKLKDINAPAGLAGYALEAEKTDQEWANEVRSLIPRAGVNSPFCKIPD